MRSAIVEYAQTLASRHDESVSESDLRTAGLLSAGLRGLAGEQGKGGDHLGADHKILSVRVEAHLAVRPGWNGRISLNEEAVDPVPSGRLDPDRNVPLPLVPNPRRTSWNHDAGSEGGRS